MFELIPFSTPTYWLNYNAVVATATGATMGDVEMSMRPYLKFVRENADYFEEAKRKSPLLFDGSATYVDENFARFMFDSVSIWTNGFAERGRVLGAMARDCEAAGRLVSAQSLYQRGSALLAIAEWSMQLDPDKVKIFEESREQALKAIALSGTRFERVAIPYGDQVLDGIFYPAEGEGPRPVAVCFNGLHSYMEWFWQNGLVDSLLKRGVSVLTFDCPGSGSARFYKNLHMEPETEKYGGAAVDWVLTRRDIDPGLIASVGCSFGGYRAVRAASVDQRFRCCLAWGALYETPQARAVREGKEPTAPITLSGLDVPTLLWFTGVNSMDEFLAKRTRFTLANVLPRLACDLAVFHGAHDMQVPLSAAERVIEEAANARSRELMVFTYEDGGEQHCHLDNLPTALNQMADWVAERLR